LLSIITNISIDHKDLLGDTLAKIAREKAGIIKHAIPVVIGETHAETAAIFQAIALEKEAPLSFADREIETEIVAKFPYQTIRVTNGNLQGSYELGLLGEYQAMNIKTVFQALTILQKCITIDKIAIENGLRKVIENTSLQGRWQKLASQPDVFCDIAHNEAGIASVMNQIKALSYSQKHIVWGMVSDKDIASIITLLPRDAVYYLTQPSIERAMSVVVLAQFFEKEGLNHAIFENVAAAIKKVKENAHCNDLIFIGGSNFVVADALKTAFFSS
jgi:dihydrofolate synthase/folylpolyglutamate synthase